MKSGFIQKTSQESESPGMRHEIQLACFRVGEAMYAIDILRIKEIIRPLRMTHVPKAPEFIEGVINLRGVVIPIVDLRKRFELKQIEADRRTRVIICSVVGKLMGLVVDEVAEVRRYTRQDVQPAPQFVNNKEAEFFLGVCRRDDELVMVLDLERILSTSEQINLDQIVETKA